MAATPYAVLLRGINVGGKNIISMADLRAAFDDEGFGPVRTYIQSGNVLLTSRLGAARLEDELEGMLERRVGKALMVVAVSLDTLQSVVDDAPKGFGTEPDAYKYDAMFLKRPLTSAQVMDVLDPREGVDRAWPGDGVVYFSRDAAQLTRSRMSKVASTPEYQRMTVRNWRTTTKLLDLLGQEPG